MHEPSPIADVALAEVQICEPGTGKLTKPAALRNVRPVGAATFLAGRCTCPVFLCDSDVWVKHRDYFSPALQSPPQLAGTPLSQRLTAAGLAPRRRRFIYDDAWGAIVLRREAWLQVTGLVSAIRAGVHPVRRQEALTRAHERTIGADDQDLECTDMSRFWENVDALVAARIGHS